MRYIGQGHEISVRFPNGVLDASSIQDIQKAFDAEYTLRYGRTTPNIAMETVTWRVVVSAPLPGIELHQNIQNPGNQALKGQRPVYFPGREAPHETPVYDRYLLPVGTKMEGPAIIEEMESTTVVGFDSRITVDDYKNLLVDLLYE